jgi:3-oxo-5-alpha-steroid 4-dehydrogenase 1
MESVGFITLLYIMFALPKELGISELPWGNWTMAACFVRLFIIYLHTQLTK